MYCSTLSFISALDGVGGQLHAPTSVSQGKKPGTRFMGGWVGPRSICTYAEYLAPTAIRSPVRPDRLKTLVLFIAE